MHHTLSRILPTTACSSRLSPIFLTKESRLQMIQHSPVLILGPAPDMWGWRWMGPWRWQETNTGCLPKGMEIHAKAGDRSVPGSYRLDFSEPVLPEGPSQFCKAAWESPSQRPWGKNRIEQNQKVLPTERLLQKCSKRIYKDAFFPPKAFRSAW